MKGVLLRESESVSESESESGNENWKEENGLTNNSHTHKQDDWLGVGQPVVVRRGSVRCLVTRRYTDCALFECTTTLAFQVKVYSTKLYCTV